MASVRVAFILDSDYERSLGDEAVLYSVVAPRHGRSRHHLRRTYLLPRNYDG